MTSLLQTGSTSRGLVVGGAVAVLSIGSFYIFLTRGPDTALLLSVALMASLLAFQRMDFLIFATALVLLVHSTHFEVIREPLEDLRWLPFLLFAFLVVGEASVTHRVRRRFYAFDMWILGFVALAFLSAFYSVSPDLTVQRAGTLVLMYGAVFWAIWRFADRRGEERVVNMLLLAAVVVYAVSWVLIPFEDSVMAKTTYQPIEGPGLIGAIRFRGLMENPNSIGLITALLLPIVLERSLRRRGLPELLLLGLMVATLVLSGSRGSMFASLIGAAFVLWKARSPMFPVVIIGAGAAAFWVYGLPITTGSWLDNAFVRPGNLFGGAGRFDGWGAGIQIIREVPILGHGFGTEQILFEEYEVSFTSGFVGGLVHNTYLGIAMQTGIVGGSMFVLPLLYLLWKQLSKTWHQRRLGLTVALQATLISGLVAGVFESWMYSMGNAFAFPFWVAVMLLIRQTIVSRRIPDERTGRVPPSAERGAAISAGNP